jgi:glycosyltransferase involved in cell wall biosynthesis
MERVIVLGRDMHALVSRKLGPGSSGRLAIIPNWADLELVTPAPSKGNRLLAELGLEGRFVVQYAGNMGRSHNLEALHAAAEQLEHERQIHFLCIGSGAKKGWLESAVRQDGLKNISILNHRPRSESQVFLNACDVAIISFVAGMSGISVPSRLYNVLAAGKPIIAVADADSELARVVVEEQAGWVVPPDNPAALAQVIREAQRRPEVLAEMGRRARRAAEHKYHLAGVVAAYARLIDELDTESETHPLAARRAA